MYKGAEHPKNNCIYDREKDIIQLVWFDLSQPCSASSVSANVKSLASSFRVTIVSSIHAALTREK